MDANRFIPDDLYRTAKGGFRGREFRRMLRLAWPYRKMLAFGLLATVVFAACHTLSIGAAFPVFKVLLEQEGLHGWVDRTVAGQRLGVELRPLAGTSAIHVRVDKVEAGSLAEAAGLQELDRLADPGARPAFELLSTLAQAEPGAVVDVQVTQLAGDAPAEPVTLHFEFDDISREYRFLRWAVSFIPADADHDKLKTLGYLLAAVIVVVVLANVFRYLGEVLIAKSILQAMMALRGRLYERTLLLPLSFFSGKPTADLVTRFVQDVQEIQRGMMTVFGKFIREPLRAAFILVLALSADWRITLTMVVVAPLAVVVFWAVGRLVKKANRKLLQAYGSMIGALTTSLQNLRVVKAYTAEDYERNRLRAVDRTVFKQQLRLAKLQAFTSPMMETVAVIAGSVAAVWLAGRVLDNELSSSRFLGLGVVLGMLFDPLRKLSDVYVRVQRSTAGAERVFQVLDLPVEQDLSEATTEVGPLKELIEFVNVSFTYPGANSPALQNVTLSIEQGETVAIVGPNGCGKTTLVSMLPRFFDPHSGEVRYDGLDIRRANLVSLRRRIGLVSQEAIVFAGTPIENITYGRPGPDDRLAQEAARRASADEFIRAIPGGYDALLGERGTTLSGGQRQRLAIARAIFRDAPILIFDEATSQIDTESELRIQTALREFSRGRTTLIIAHRLSTIQFANRIIVMDAGRVIDSGSHEALFKRCPLYRTLCETQFLNETGPIDRPTSGP